MNETGMNRPWHPERIALGSHLGDDTVWCQDCSVFSRGVLVWLDCFIVLHIVYSRRLSYLAGREVKIGWWEVVLGSHDCHYKSNVKSDWLLLKGQMGRAEIQLDSIDKWGCLHEPKLTNHLNACWIKKSPTNIRKNVLTNVNDDILSLLFKWMKVVK